MIGFVDIMSQAQNYIRTSSIVFLRIERISVTIFINDIKLNWLLYQYAIIKISYQYARIYIFNFES